jgi:hypothetical protein
MPEHKPTSPRTGPHPGTNKDAPKPAFEEPKLTFVEPQLTPRGDLREVTGFFGGFSP